MTEAYTYNPDGTVATRTDYAISTTPSTFGYDALGHLTSAWSPLFGSGQHVHFTWRLDGLLATKANDAGPATLVYAYDGAKRPIAACNGTNGACSGAQIDLERTYDRAGNVTSETQNFSSGATVSQQGIQYYTYDPLNRVLTSSLNAGQAYAVVKAYTYDSDGNRLTVRVNGVTTDTFTFDRTDATINDTPSGGSAVAFVHDRYGSLTSQRTYGAAGGTSYAYDLADRLTSITQADASVIGFTFNAAGRHATRTSGTGQNLVTIDTYSYLGDSDTVIVDAPASGSSTRAAIDSIGDRLCTSAGSGFGWIVADLHGNVAGQLAATSPYGFLDVLRYDAYGKAVGTPGTASSVPTPWRFQGRILESTTTTGNSDAYDFDARSYLPDLGTFTSLDSVAGSAQNPLTLNRYLYAEGNPATMSDPSGHWACKTGREDCENLSWVQTATVNSATGFTTGSHGTWAEVKPRVPAVNQAAVDAATASRWAGAGASAAGTEAAARGRGCDWNPFASNSCLGHAANTVNQGWQATGGAVVNYGTQHLDQVALAAGAIALGGACIIATAGVCAGIITGAVVGGGISGGVYGVGCATGQECSLGGFIQNVAIGAEIGGLTGGVTSWLGGAGSAATQGANGAASLVDTAGANGVGGLSQAGRFGVWGYRTLQSDIQGLGLQAHHLVEQRFAGILGQNAADMASIAVTQAERQVFTNLWRAAIPYGSGTANATAAQVYKAAAEIYQGFPAILSVLGL